MARGNHACGQQRQRGWRHTAPGQHLPSPAPPRRAQRPARLQRSCGQGGDLSEMAAMRLLESRSATPPVAKPRLHLPGKLSPWLLEGRVAQNNDGRRCCSAAIDEQSAHPDADK
ncbi:unnamed protein product [Lampetra fluviatilis]